MLHYSEVLEKLAMESISFLDRNGPNIEKLVLINDLRGKFRFLIFTGDDSLPNALIQLADKIDPKRSYWTGDIWHCSSKTSTLDRKLYESTWEEARQYIEFYESEEEAEWKRDESIEKFRWLDRTRNRTAWFRLREPIWDIYKNKNPPVVVFYSFKGGMGRTTTLASQALACAREGKRVVVLDMDFDAPGVGSLFSSLPEEQSAYGLVDFLLELPEDSEYLSDYYYKVTRKEITGSGELFVFPAGDVDQPYLSQLAKLDVETEDAVNPGLDRLLEYIRSGLKPDIIFIDSRAGLADTAGLLMDGMAHFHILFGTPSSQSIAGLEVLVRHLGRDRIFYKKNQADCRVVQAMVPQDLRQKKELMERFLLWSEEFFPDHYYLESGQDAVGWTVDDMETSTAPHQPVTLDYNPALATFDDIEEVVHILLESSGYKELYNTIIERFSGTPLWQKD